MYARGRALAILFCRCVHPYSGFYEMYTLKNKDLGLLSDKIAYVFKCLTFCICFTSANHHQSFFPSQRNASTMGFF